jgi:hypothetical protein
VPQPTATPRDSLLLLLYYYCGGGGSSSSSSSRSGSSVTIYIICSHSHRNYNKHYNNSKVIKNVLIQFLQVMAAGAGALAQKCGALIGQR